MAPLPPISPDASQVTPPISPDASQVTHLA